MLWLYPLASRIGSSCSSSEPEGAATASCHIGQARAERGIPKPASRTRSKATNQNRFIRSSFPSIPLYFTVASPGWIETVEHPVHHHAGDRDVKPDRQRPAGDADVTG